MNPIDELLDAEAEAAEAAESAELSSDPDAPLPAGTTVTRGHPRAKNLQIRLREGEYEQLAAYAERRGLPISTVGRALLLRAVTPVSDLKSALDRLESDIAAVRLAALGRPKP
ncbi:MAG: hypothetical protein ACRC0L_11575 [Angustibacter sp.]